jgi:hypothetical protein
MVAWFLVAWPALDLFIFAATGPGVEPFKAPGSVLSGVQRTGTGSVRDGLRVILHNQIRRETARYALYVERQPGTLYT